MTQVQDKGVRGARREGGRPRTRRETGGLGSVPIDVGPIPLLATGGASVRCRATRSDRRGRAWEGRLIDKKGRERCAKVSQIGTAGDGAPKSTPPLRLFQVFHGIAALEVGRCTYHMATAGIVGAQRARLPRWGLGWRAGGLSAGPGYGGPLRGRGPGSPLLPAMAGGQSSADHAHKVPFCPARAVRGRR